MQELVACKAQVMIQRVIVKMKINRFSMSKFGGKILTNENKKKKNIFNVKIQR